MNAPNLEDLTWRKSTRSGANGNCVEAARLADGWYALRDGKDPDGPALLFSAVEWDIFVGRMKDGDFDRW